jgi:vacuolar-type H+-ATPase subunit C/Vma6
MTNLFDETLTKGKQSLGTVLRNKAYDDVKETLAEKGIDINDIEESDLEELVAAKVSDMQSGLKGFAAGSLFMALLGFY